MLAWEAAELNGTTTSMAFITVRGRVGPVRIWNKVWFGNGMAWLLCAHQE